MGADCPSPNFHASCALDMDDDATADSETWMCDDCEMRNALLRDIDPAFYDLVEATLLPPSDHAQLLARRHVPVADVPNVLGVPRALCRHNPNDVTQTALAITVKNVARFWRHSHSLWEALLQISV